MASLVILESDVNELEDLNQRLVKDGLRSDLSWKHKLRYLWRLLQRSENSLQSALDDLSNVRRQQTVDMLKVESYVSHIRNLSEEQKEMIAEFEIENTELKQQIELIEKDKQAIAEYTKNIHLLLRENGFPNEDVIQENCLSQIACLLREKDHQKQLHGEHISRYEDLEVQYKEASESLANCPFIENESLSMSSKVKTLVELHENLIQEQDIWKRRFQLLEKDNEENRKKLSSLETVSTKRESDIEEMSHMLDTITCEELSNFPLNEKIAALARLMTDNACIAENQRRDIEDLSEKHEENVQLKIRLDEIEKLLTESKMVNGLCVEDKIVYVLGHVKEMDDLMNLKQNEMLQLRQDFEKLETIKSKFEKDQMEMAENMSILENECIKYQCCMNELEIKLKQSEHESEEFKSLNAMLKDVDATLRDELKKMAKEVTDMKKHHDLEIKELAKSYEDELNTSIQNHDSEMHDMEEERNQYNKLTVEIKQLRENISYLERENKLLKEENGSQQEKRLLLEKLTMDLKSANEKFEKSLEEQSKLGIEVNLEKEKLQKRRNELSVFVDANTLLKEHLDAANGQKAKELEAKEEQLKTIKSDLRRKNIEISNLKSSHSRQMKQMQDTNAIQKNLISQLKTQLEELCETEELIGAVDSTMPRVQTRNKVEEEKNEMVDFRIGRSTLLKNQNSELKKTLKEVIDELNKL